MLHQAQGPADVTVMDAIDLEIGDEEPLEPVEQPEAEVTGDHPDPITLWAPAYDDQGLLRWGSLPSPRI